MPHSMMKSATDDELSEVLTSPPLSLAVDCPSSAIYPSIYRGGTVDLLRSRVCRVTSIVSQADYWHLSPEVRYCITCAGVRVCSRILRTTCVRRNCASGTWRYIWIPLVGSFRTRWSIRSCLCVYSLMMLASSLQEERLRYYLDEGLTSVPRFGSPMTAPAFSVSSRVKPTTSDSGSNYLGLGCPAPGTTDGESVTSTCSLCAARLDADAEGDEEYEATSEGSGRDTRKFFFRLSSTTFSF
jgi:hypothetical protein